MIINQKTIDEFWNIKAPLVTSKFSKLLTNALSDSTYFSYWSKLNTWSAPIFLIIGWIIGFFSLFYKFSLTESTFLISLFLLIGIINPRFGLIFFIGFLIGDFLGVRLDSFDSYRFNKFSTKFIYFFSFPIYYTLLLSGFIWIPLSGKSLAYQTSFYLRKKPLLESISFILLQCSLTAILIYFWAQVSALLIRPLWVWQKTSPSLEAIAPLQKNWWIFIIISIVAVLIRNYLEIYALSKNSSLADSSINEIDDQITNPTIFSKIPLPIIICLNSLWITYMLSGMLLRWWEALIIFSSLLPIYALKKGWIVRFPKIWIHITTKIPILIRLAVGVIISWHTSLFLTKKLWNVRWADGGTSFMPVMVSVLSSLIILCILLPESRKKLENFKKEIIKSNENITT